MDLGAAFISEWWAFLSGVLLLLVEFAAVFLCVRAVFRFGRRVLYLAPVALLCLAGEVEAKQYKPSLHWVDDGANWYVEMVDPHHDLDVQLLHKLDNGYGLGAGYRYVDPFPVVVGSMQWRVDGGGDFYVEQWNGLTWGQLHKIGNGDSWDDFGPYEPGYDAAAAVFCGIGVMLGLAVVAFLSRSLFRWRW